MQNHVAIILVSALIAGCASTPSTRATRESSRQVNAAEQRCLALAMYWEARGEGERGMLAVGSVVLNRVASRDFPNRACAVVRQGGESPPCQFSWWCDGKSDVPRARPQWNAALTTADYMLRVHPKDPTYGALFFHSTAIKSPWLRSRERTVRIGGHVFYR